MSCRLYLTYTQWTVKPCVDQGMQGSDHIELNEINSFLTCGRYAMAEKRSLLVKITWESVCMACNSNSFSEDDRMSQSSTSMKSGGRRIWEASSSETKNKINFCYIFRSLFLDLVCPSTYKNCFCIQLQHWKLCYLICKGINLIEQSQKFITI